MAANNASSSYDLVLAGPDLDLAELRSCTSLPVVPLRPLGTPRLGHGPSVTLPVRAPYLREVVDAVLSGSPAPSTGQVTAKADVAFRGTLLVVEDNLVNQKVAALTLERHGYVVEVAANGARALDALALRSYDAVLMDCQMPVLDGYAATQELRRREAGGRRTPVIALTASAMTEDRERCAAAGMDDHVSKPIDAAELLTVLRRWTGTAEPLLDAAVVAELDGLGEGVRDELTALFARDAEQRLAELASAPSAVASASAAHALKGASQAVGAAGVTARVARLEERARLGEQPTATELHTLRGDVAAALAALSSPVLVG